MEAKKKKSDLQEKLAAARKIVLALTRAVQTEKRLERYNILLLFLTRICQEPALLQNNPRNISDQQMPNGE
jgi:hypothetical protein